MRFHLRSLVPVLATAAALTLLGPAASAHQGAAVVDGELVYRGPAGAISLHEPTGAIENLTVLERGDVVAVTWLESGAESFALSLDGGASFGRARTTSYDVLLRYQAFDPLADGEPAVPAELAMPAGGQLFIVQYVTKGAEPWREEIRAMGGVDHRFLGNHANIWRMSPDTAAAVAELPFVRWVGAFHPAYKLEDELVAAHAANALEASRLYNVVVGEWGPTEKAVVASAIREMGGEVTQSIEQGWIVEANLTPQQLLAVVAMDEVLGVDRRQPDEVDMNIVRTKMGANYIETQGGYDGTGVRAEVMDDGLDTGRPEWRYPPILHGSVTSGSHGTSTYSINFADTGGSSRGLAPDAQGIISDFGSYGGNRYNHTAQLVSSPYFGVYQSNSWGGGRTASYTSTSQQMDDIIYLNDIVITQSQSNAGSTQSRPEAWAKNICAVGGIRHYNNTNDNDDNWSFGASTGPAQDGRVKPDMSAYYDSVNTVNNSSFGGTSAASPIVAGHFALIHEMWHDGIFGNTPGATVFDSRPHSTTARAMMINSAWQWPDNQNDITRTRQGWGRPDVQYLYDNRDDMFYVDESWVLKDQESKLYSLDVQGAAEFRATLVYVDRAGTTSSSLHRINDLNLKVIDPNGQLYWGNNGLVSGAYNSSDPGGTPNDKDCVEQVIIPNPPNGTWTVEVIAEEVNQDSHPETAQVDADYALIVTPAEETSGGGTNTIQLIGPTLAFPGSTVTWTWNGAPSSGTWYLLWSLSNAGSTIQGHPFDLGGPINIGATGTLTSSTGSYTQTLPAAASGNTIYIEFGTQNGSNIRESNMLAMVVL